MAHPRHARRRTQATLATSAAVAALTLLVGCGPVPASSAGGRLVVVAGENAWGSIAAEIGGPRVSVTSIITDPAADPHTYEADPRTAAALDGASLVIENGAGYDRFLDKLLGVASQQSRDVLSIANAVALTGDNPNPHLWYSPAYVIAGARAIEAHLATHDSANAPIFAANLQRFLGTYQPYVDTLARISLRYGGAPIAYTERVPGYLVATARLRLATPASFAQAIEDGNDPAPADTSAMNAAMTEGRVRLLLYNAQVTSPATQRVKDLAAARKIPIVGVAETLPAGASSFEAWQIGQARTILTALGG
ncbi:MAG: metal ABC transporter solute-binding protein, Zn/Mn family [Candidatus Dormibacteria bacterium]